MQGDESSDTIGNLTALPSLTYTYHPQLTLNSLGSYVTGTTYDAAGRITSRLLGSSGLKQVFTYTAWNTPNQGGRLDTIQAGTAPTYSNLQNLDYGYDKIGNILTILDAANSSQKQCFTYDALYRLTRGTTTNDTQNGCGTTQLGNGNYDLATTYDAATGNLSGKAGVSYGYNDANHDHAVTHLGGVQKYWYDANGNQVTRIVGSDTFNLTYDAENRLVEVKKNNITIATFVYDGDGNRVQSSVGGVTTAFVGNHTEWEVGTGSLTRYYYAGNTRIAMRKNNAVYYLLGDHFPLQGASRGSTSVTTDQNGQNPAVQLYAPWGEVRYSSGSLQTKYTYTGQYSNVGDFGLMFYNARWYDPALSRFTSADTIVPELSNPTNLDRYAYVRDNPLNYFDPSGHITQAEAQDAENILQQLGSYDIEIKIDWGMKLNKWIDGFWTLNELLMVLDAVTDLAISMGGADNFKSNLGGVVIAQKEMTYGGLGGSHKVTLNASNFSKWTVVHELAHAWDGVNGWNLSDNMGHNLGAGFRHPIRHFLNDNDPRY